MAARTSRQGAPGAGGLQAGSVHVQLQKSELRDVLGVDPARRRFRAQCLDIAAEPVDLGVQFLHSPPELVDVHASQESIARARHGIGSWTADSTMKAQ